MRKDYRIIYKQEFEGEVLQDSYIKYDATITEMGRAIHDIYADPHVISARYEEVKEATKC